jgi:hypothetical protein
MGADSAMLIGAGVLFSILNLILGIFELGTLRTIRPPKQKTFTYLRLAENQFQNVVLPALGALISGLFVSMSASFFYAGMTNPGDSSPEFAGPALFMAAGVALAVTLGVFLKGVGEPAELARDPFTIRAAADEYSTDPRRGPLEPSLLQQRLDEWTEYISTRSMNLAAKKKSLRLERILAGAAKQQTFWCSVGASLYVYLAVLLRFPFRFGWPFLGFVLVAVGAILWAVGEEERDFATSWRLFVTIAVLAVSNAVVALFYCATRGNRARLWHRINLAAVDDARKAIDVARNADVAVKAEDAVLRRVIERANKFFEGEQAAPANLGVTFTLGMFHIAVRPKTQKRRESTS